MLYFDRRNPWVDVPSLLLKWVEVSRIQSGFLLRPFNAYDQPHLDRNMNIVCIACLVRGKPLTATFLDFRGFPRKFPDQFERNRPGPFRFRRTLFSAGEYNISWTRNGGTIGRFACGRGWSADFSNMTIVRYLVGRTDGMDEARENFMNPEVSLGVYCVLCGRKYACA